MTPREPVSRAAEALPAALALGLALLGGLLRVVFAGGPNALLGISGGCLVAALGLDLYARGVGAWVARHRPPLAVLLALGGSPAVLLHAVLGRRRGLLAPEPGALAGLLVPVVLVVVVWATAAG